MIALSPPAARTQKTSMRKPRQEFKGHTGEIRGVIHLQGGQRTITCSGDGSLRLWNVENGLQIGKDWRDGEREVLSIALSPDGKTVMSGGGDGIVRLWSVDTGKVIAKWMAYSEGIWCVHWSQDGQRAVSGVYGYGPVRVWDVRDRQTLLGQIDTGSLVWAAIYSPDDAMIATAGNDKLIKIWDAKTSKLVKTLKGHTDRVRCLAWTPDALFSGSYDASIRKWNTTSWKQVAVWTEHTSGVFAIAASPNGRILASGSYDGTARLWNLENSQPIGLPLQHIRGICCISFSADGRLLATGRTDSNAYTWDVSAIVKEAGSDDLLLDSDDPASKAILNVDATRRPPRSPNNTRSLPQGFFDVTENHIHSPSTQLSPRSSARQTSPSRLHLRFNLFSLLFRRFHPAVHDATAQRNPPSFGPLHLPLSYLSRRHRSDGEQRPDEVEVPYTRGQARNIKVTRKPKAKVPVPRNIVNVSVFSSSQPPNTGVVQQPSVNPSGQELSSQPESAINGAQAQAATTATTTTPGAATLLHSDSASDIVVIRQAGCWTRFWLFLGCISIDNHR